MKNSLFVNKLMYKNHLWYISEQLAAFVGAYDDIIKGSFAQFVTLSGKIGGDVKTQVRIEFSVDKWIHPLRMMECNNWTMP